MKVVVVKEGKSPAKRETVFVLTVMWLDESGNESPSGGQRRCRTWGWFPTLELAEESVFANHADMYEDGYYNTVVIEEMRWGALAVSESERWYSAKPSLDGDDRIVKYTVQATEKPKSQLGVCNFGMG